VEFRALPVYYLTLNDLNDLDKMYFGIQTYQSIKHIRNWVNKRQRFWFLCINTKDTHWNKSHCSGDIPAEKVMCMDIGSKVWNAIWIGMVLIYHLDLSIFYFWYVIVV
jgi:hypothetical protein